MIEIFSGSRVIPTLSSTFVSWFLSENTTDLFFRLGNEDLVVEANHCCAAADCFFDFQQSHQGTKRFPGHFSLFSLLTTKRAFSPFLRTFENPEIGKIGHSGVRVHGQRYGFPLAMGFVLRSNRSKP